MAVATLDPAPADALPLDTILCGDALEMLRTLPDNLVDSIVTDPPAGISFMGKGWDSNKGGRDAWIAWLAEIMRETWRVTKPGGHALVWALPRTSHWTAMALEDAGFEVRDCVTHLFGSGFPKSLDVSKAIDKAAGAQRAKIGPRTYAGGHVQNFSGVAHDNFSGNWAHNHGSITIEETAPATDAARTWDGWGTALKPAVEDWWLCRKPLSEPNVAANVLRWGTGALNIGASRVATTDKAKFPSGVVSATEAVYGGGAGRYANRPRTTDKNPAGRWPANLLLSHAPDCDERGCSLWCPIRELNAQSGIRKSPTKVKQGRRSTANVPFGSDAIRVVDGPGDTGGASRYFTTFAYVPKASRSERNRGCLALSSKDVHRYGAGLVQGQHPEAPVIEKNSHPTVKPLALMSWLIRLITPPGGIVLDPFAGSGSTLCAAKAGGWRYIGIEKEAEYVSICRARVQAS